MPEANKGKLQKMTELKSREIRLKTYPDGLPTAETFEFCEVSVPDPSDGEFRVRNIYMSVDPYMRGRMRRGESYVAAFEVGKPLDGGSIGVVETSNNPDFPEGTLVQTGMGWREYFNSDGQGINKVRPIEGASLTSLMGAAGGTGLTAYVGLFRIAAMQDGETVFVSAAAGAVGQIACQIAKIKGCFVIGSAGSDEKCRWLEDECGVDATINYKTCGDITKALAAVAPKGIDVYFENVGGEHLEAAINCMNVKGRIAVCGMISQYNAREASAGPSNLISIIGKDITMRGYVLGNHFDMAGDFYKDISKWISEGKIKWSETVYDGIEKAPEAFIGLFEGKNSGKMLVRLSDEPK
jgi:NADPH-dependent curcumin reductase CurA